MFYYSNPTRQYDEERAKKEYELRFLPRTHFLSPSFYHAQNYHTLGLPYKPQLPVICNIKCHAKSNNSLIITQTERKREILLSQYDVNYLIRNINLY